MPETTPIPLRQPPGINRDATTLESDRAVDGRWARWFGGRARKMGGYVSAIETLTGPVRGLNLHWAGSPGYVHSFHRTGIERFTITGAGVVSAVSDRTPAGFINDANNNWQFGVMYDAASAASSIIAHCTENLGDLGAGTSRPIYFGDVSATAALVTTGQSVDGGILVAPPYLFGYGANGDVSWTDANSPTVWAGGDAGTARVAGTKVVKGLRTRGSGDATSALFWSLDSLLLGTYVGGTAIFQFRTLSDKINVLSSAGIVEYEGRYYWPGVDRFMTYDGTVRTLPNDLNVNYFYDNLNYDQRQKVWGTVVPRFGEIWWHYPSGAATECDKAVIFNVHETRRTGSPVWYDTPSARSAGHPPGDFRFPLWTDTADTAKAYMHENGVDDVTDAGTSAINSYFETGVLTWVGLAQKDASDDLNRWFHLDRIEPDFTQVGDMTVTVRGRKYARTADVDASAETFTATTEKIDIREQRRYMRLLFTSNVATGNYENGQTILHAGRGDGRQ